MTKLSANTVDLVNCPPNLLSPEAFADLIQETLGDTYSVEIYCAEDLEEKGCGSLLAFGSGSQNKPLLVKITPAKPSGLHIIAEGTIAETGGVQLLPRTDVMKTKVGKAGAAIALEALTKENSGATFWIPLSENIPSQTAMRPSDIVTLPNGYTVEATELRAQGHLALFDAYVLAAEDGAETIISISSCDPVQNLAVGYLYSAVIGDNEAVQLLRDAADVSGENVWPLPLSEHAAETVTSQLADTANAGSAKASLLANCSVFQKILAECEKTPQWAHWEIGSPSVHHEKLSDEKGATGYGVATLQELIKR